MTEMIEDITPSEFTVLMFIFARTYLFNKTHEKIFIDQFLRGIQSQKNGKKYAGKLPFKERRLQEIIKGLHSKGFINRDRDGDFTWMSINQNWTKNHDVQETMKNTASSNAEKCTHKSKNNKSNNKSQKDSGDKSPLSVQEKDFLDKSENRKVSLPDNNVEKPILKKIHESVPELEKLWHAEMKATYPEYQSSPWSPKERGQMKQFASGYREKNGSGQFSEYMKFAINNWNRIIQMHFRWVEATHPPYPDVGFYYAHRRRFDHYYSDEKFYEREMGLSEKERSISRYKRLGYTATQAHEAWASDLEKSAPVRRVSEKLDSAQQDVRALSRMNKDLQQNLTRERIRVGRMIIKQERKDQREKLNPDSTPKKRRQYDAEGYAILDSSFFEVKNNAHTEVKAKRKRSRTL